MARRKNDFYPTPKSATLALLDAIPMIRGASVFEPCAGQGDIEMPLCWHGGCTVKSNDIDRQFKTDFHFDATKQWLPPHMHVDWVITNPPFSCAMTIIENTLNHFEQVRCGMAFLLRLSFLEPTKDRQGFLKSAPP
jgi:hypothetical protein